MKLGRLLAAHLVSAHLTSPSIAAVDQVLLQLGGLGRRRQLAHLEQRHWAQVENLAEEGILREVQPHAGAEDAAEGVVEVLPLPAVNRQLLLPGDGHRLPVEVLALEGGQHLAKGGSLLAELLLRARLLTVGGQGGDPLAHLRLQGVQRVLHFFVLLLIVVVVVLLKEQRHTLPGGNSQWKVRCLKAALQLMDQRGRGGGGGGTGIVGGEKAEHGQAGGLQGVQGGGITRRASNW